LVAITVYGSDGMFSEGEMGEIERKVISDANLDKKDFIVPGLGNCSAKGNWREILCPVNDLKYEIGEDSYSMMFSLSKGNYATCLMREFLKTDMNRY
jgi:tRNA pseudouridine13 synthase